MTKNARKPNVLLAVTGSVAGIKGPELAVRIHQDCNATVRVLLTKGGTKFWDKGKGYNRHYWDSMIELSSGEDGPISVFGASDEWEEWNEVGDPVMHIDLRDWADLLLIAPLSAHTLAKLANGLCDDTLSCVVRAWDFGHGVRPGKPLLLAPAMNTAMYDHPLTSQQLARIQSFWNEQMKPNRVTRIDPQVKTLACGEVGNGALACVDAIISAVQQALAFPQEYLTIQMR
jgi:phosphopantothenoylcysteine decarboxylase